HARERQRVRVAPARGFGLAEPPDCGAYGILGWRSQQRRHEPSTQRGCMERQMLGDERAHEVVAVVVARAFAKRETLPGYGARSARAGGPRCWAMNVLPKE